MAARRTKKRRRPNTSQGKSDLTVGVNIRVLKSQLVIIDRLTSDKRAKNRSLNRTDIIKELMEMTRAGLITPEERERFFEDCDRAFKEEEERKENLRRKLKLPTPNNDKSGYIHEPAKPAAAYSLPGDTPLKLVRFDEDDPLIKTGD